MEVITRKQAKEQGLKHYFTGKPCKHGHIAKRVTAGGCVECMAVNQRAHEERRRARRLADPAFDAKMKAKQNRAAKKYTERHPERRQQLRDAWLAVPENRARKLFTNNRNKQTEHALEVRRARRNLRYQEDLAYRDRCKVHAADQNTKRRRARNAVVLTVQEQMQVEAIYQLRIELTRATGVEYHVDHRIPLAKGGKHHPDNLWVIPAVDNLRKGAKMPEELAA